MNTRYIATVSVTIDVPEDLTELEIANAVSDEVNRHFHFKEFSVPYTSLSMRFRSGVLIKLHPLIERESRR